MAQENVLDHRRRILVWSLIKRLILSHPLCPVIGLTASKPLVHPRGRPLLHRNPGCGLRCTTDPDAGGLEEVEG